MMTGTIRKVGGIALIVVGLIAVPVPIIPGIPLIAAGAAMLGGDHPIVLFCMRWLRKLRSIDIWRKERNQDELSDVQG